VHTPVIVLLADGLRADTLRHALDGNALPAMAALRNDGVLCAVTSTFPSVTGPAYVPFLLGRFPASVGIPGLRWFDRSRTAATFPDYARSYVGWQMNAVNRDLDPAAPTIFELARGSAGALSMITRGLPREGQLATLNLRSAIRATRTHFSGDLAEWLVVDRETSRKVVARARSGDTPFIFAAFMGVDKLSHARGQDPTTVAEALRILDTTVAALRDTRPGSQPHVWVASDHGHSPVGRHDDLHRLTESMGYRVMAHPWVWKRRADIAVMVSGNAMAHLYLDLRERERAFWTRLAPRWQALADTLLARESVDLVLLPLEAGRCVVVSRTHGRAVISRDASGISYTMEHGDPLGIGGSLHKLDRAAAWDITCATDYPDSLVQIATLAASSRCGDIVLSAARGWDFRERYEPIPHASSHGALHRDHMRVPLLIDRPPAHPPRRTTDIFASALGALGIRAPSVLDGESFL
jgi:hypothetical protein